MISIAPISVKDIARLKALAVKTFQESHGHSAPGADVRAYLDRSFNPRILEAELKDRKNFYFFAEVSGKAAGYSKLMLNSSCPQAPEPMSCKLERLYLLEEFHGQHIGRQLFQFNLDLSKKMGQTGIWLYVWRENKKALAFYRKNGFAIVGSFDFRISETHSNPNHVLYLKY